MTTTRPAPLYSVKDADNHAVAGLTRVSADNALVLALAPARPLPTLAVEESIAATDRSGARYWITREE